MKAILEFNLPDDQPDFDQALKAHEYHSALSEISLYLRQLQKYDGYLEFKDTAEMAVRIRQRFYEITSDLDLP